MGAQNVAHFAKLKMPLTFRCEYIDEIQLQKFPVDYIPQFERVAG